MDISSISAVNHGKNTVPSTSKSRFSIRQAWDSLKEFSKNLSKNISHRYTPKSDSDPDGSLKKIEHIAVLLHQNQPLKRDDLTTTKISQHHLPGIYVDTLPPIQTSNTEESPTTTPAILPRDTSNLSNQKKQTELAFDQLVSNGCSFFLLNHLIRLAHIQDPNLDQNIALMMDQVSTLLPHHLSDNIKLVFYKKYKHQIPRIGRLKIWVFLKYTHLFLSSSIFETYKNHLLDQLRTSKNGINEQFLSQISRFLDLYKSATLDYAQTKNPLGIVQQYREKALNQMFSTSLKHSCEKLISSWINLAPSLNFFTTKSKIHRLFNQITNWAFKSILSQHATNAIEVMILHTNKNAENFTKYFIDSISQKIQKLNTHSDDPFLFAKDSSSFDPHNIKRIIKDIFYIAKFSYCHTQESILHKKDELEKTNAIDEEIENHLSNLLVKIIESFSCSLSDPLIIENILSQTLTALNTCLFQEKPFTDSDLLATKDHFYFKIQNLGKYLTRHLFKQRMLQLEYQPQKHSIEHLLATHQSQSIDLCLKLDEITLDIVQKTKQEITILRTSNPPPEKSSNSEEISNKVKLMTELLEGYIAQEKALTDTTHLSTIEKDKILRYITSIYQKFEKALQKILSIQKWQLNYEKIGLEIKESSKTTGILARFVRNEEKQKHRLINLLEELTKEGQNFSQHLNLLKQHIRSLSRKEDQDPISNPPQKSVFFFNFGKNVAHQIIDNPSPEINDITSQKITSLIDNGFTFFLFGKVQKPLSQILLEYYSRLNHT